MWLHLSGKIVEGEERRHDLQQSNLILSLKKQQT